ncbi:hypothetical protein FM107_03075 [Sphingobacterium sp. JB170]|nr:hypothetical protein FM107_03075 [Sphingobacterium sp. JB170]
MKIAKFWISRQEKIFIRRAAAIYFSKLGDHLRIPQKSLSEEVKAFL